jgi:hypothetical protein
LIRARRMRYGPGILTILTCHEAREFDEIPAAPMPLFLDVVRSVDYAVFGAR